jgi:hypothetical protein
MWFVASCRRSESVVLKNHNTETTKKRGEAQRNTENSEVFCSVCLGEPPCLRVEASKHRDHKETQRNTEKSRVFCSVCLGEPPCLRVEASKHRDHKEAQRNTEKSRVFCSVCLGESPCLRVEESQHEEFLLVLWLGVCRFECATNNRGIS